MAFEASKEIITPETYTTGADIPVNGKIHHFAEQMGSMEGWREIRNLRL
jgi:hypothetical protein